MSGPLRRFPSSFRPPAWATSSSETAGSGSPLSLVVLGLLLAAPTAATSTHPLTLDGPGPEATTPAPSTLASPAPDTLRIRIVPEQLELAHMAESQLAVEVVEPAGPTFDAEGLVWYSQDPEVVFVGPGGVVRARTAAPPPSRPS